MIDLESAPVFSHWVDPTTHASPASCSWTDGTLNITTSSALEAISSCTTFDGSLRIMVDQATIDLGSIEEITDLLYIQPLRSQVEVTASKLQTARSVYFLGSPDVIADVRLDMPQLSDQLYWLGVEVNLQVDGGLEVSYVSVDDDSIPSVNLSGLTAVDDTLWISGTQRLTDFVAPDLAAFTVEGESSRYPVVHIYENPVLYNVSFPSLQTVPGRITLEDNPSLSAVEIPDLEEAGWFELENNESLEDFTAPALTRVDGVTIKGQFSNVKFPSLTEVGSNFTVKGSADLDCSWLDENIKPIVQGTYECVAEDSGSGSSSSGGSSVSPNQDSPSGTSQSGNSTGGSSSGLSTGAKAGIGAGVGAGVLAIVVLLGWFFWRRKREARRENGMCGGGGSGDDVGTPELDGGHGVGDKGSGGNREKGLAELESSQSQMAELDGPQGQTVSELPAHDRSRMYAELE